MTSPTVHKFPHDSLLSPTDVKTVLSHDTVAASIMEKNDFPSSGDLVGVRLNLNVLKSTGQAIQTVHRCTNAMAYKKNKGFYNGKVRGYAQAVVLKNAYFLEFPPNPLIPVPYRYEWVVLAR